jgi:hypothetical protein
MAAYGQQLSQEAIRTLFVKTDSLVMGYLNDAAFLAPGQKSVGAAEIARFKRHFDALATVPDEMNPGFFYGDAYRLQHVGKLNAGTYAARMVQNYPTGLTVKLLYYDIDLSALRDRLIRVLLVKRTQGFRSSGTEMLSTDTVMLNLGISSTFDAVSISSIDLLGHELVATIDKDGYQRTIEARRRFMRDSADVVARCEVDRQDRQQKLDKLISEPPRWWIAFGAHGGMLTTTLSELNPGYANLIAPNLRNPATAISGLTPIGGDIQIAHFLGPKASFGIGAGAAFTSMSGTIQKDAFAVQYQANDPGRPGRSATTYRQHITAKGAVREQLQVTNLRLPISLIYKSSAERKIGFQLEAGVAYNLQFSATGGLPSTSFDYEAVYRYQGTGSSVNGVFDNGATPAADAWLLTGDFLSKHGDAASRIGQLNGAGYNVGLGVSAFANPNLDGQFQSGSIGFFVRPAVRYQMNKTSALSLGVWYEQTSFKNTSTDYRLVTEGTATQGSGLQNPAYNTLLNSISSMQTGFLGLRISFTHALFFTESKWRKEKEDLSRKTCGYGQVWSIK